MQKLSHESALDVPATEKVDDSFYLRVWEVAKLCNMKSSAVRIKAAGIYPVKSASSRIEFSSPTEFEAFKSCVTETTLESMVRLNDELAEGERE
jgi:hypothetical protein